MKVLWIVNTVLPAIAQEVRIKTGVSGGWLLDLADQVSAHPSIEMAVATVYSGHEFIDGSVPGMHFFLLPGGSRRMIFYAKQNERYWEEVERRFPADIVHLHGTEYTHGLAFLRRFPRKRALLTIQGIITRIASAYLGGMTLREAISCRTPAEYLHLNGILENLLLHRRNTRYEAEIIRSVRYVTGRTLWDKAVLQEINPSIHYYRCNYNLRGPFYQARKWDVRCVQRHSVFTGQALTPLKGLHMLLRALAIVVRHHPDCMLYVPGYQGHGGYARYLQGIIRRLGLGNHVQYIGSQDASGMADWMLRSHVVVVPSAIEGASATLCEAMYLGVPCIASFRGGMTELLDDKVSGFYYDFPEYGVLAQRIVDVFADDKMASSFSRAAVRDAERRHDRTQNPAQMIELYRQIMRDCP